MSKIGIGVLTYNRPKHIDLNTKMIAQHFPKSKYTAHVVEHDSSERKGIAYRSNEALRRLKKIDDFDYYFLFNDDCFPIKDGWADFFINTHKASGQHHMMYLKETPQHRKMRSKSFDGIEIYEYDNCSGCMLFLTKEVIEKVGAFNEEFGRYGFEHAEYSDRIHMAGLTPMGKYLCPAGAGEYIYSLDLDNHLPYNKQLKHAPSMPVKEQLECIQKSQQVYNRVMPPQIYRTL